jgi:uncharacterized membrane protein YhhN
VTDDAHPTLPAARRLSLLLPTPTARSAATVFAALVLVHLGAQLAGVDLLSDASQWLLMPALAATVWCATSAPRPRLVRLVLLALGFSWLGDSAPDLTDGDAAFLVMVGFFLCAQVTYAVALWPMRRESVARRPALLVPYAVAFAALVAACAGDAGALLPAVVVYGLCLATMAVLATGLGPLAAVGGAVFLVSDAMIALGSFTEWFNPPVSGFWVMLTYTAGQALLAAGVLARSAEAVRAAGDTAPSTVAGR